MAAPLPTNDAEALGLDPARVEALIGHAARHVAKAGLPSAQLAIARHGRLARVESFGPEGDDRLYVFFSTTKALVSAAVWLLLQEGRLDLDGRVSDLVPGFGASGKHDVRLEHLLTHTAGFPDAHLRPADWAEVDRRLAAFASWSCQWEPGARFVYHPTATLWVLADIIERCSGQDFRVFIRERITGPLGLDDLHLGLPEDLNDRVSPVSHVGKAPPGLLLRMLGIRLPARAVDEAYFESYNTPGVRAVGVPSSGAVGTAGDLALFYQALLGFLPGPWTPATLADALQIRTGDLLDPMTGKRANRALGVVIAGTRARVYRGFGRHCSPTTFGHPGAGGQIAWADPETGISFVFLTSGFDRNTLRMGMRGASLSSRAARAGLAAPDGAKVDDR